MTQCYKPGDHVKMRQGMRVGTKYGGMELIQEMADMTGLKVLSYDPDDGTYVCAGYDADGGPDLWWYTAEMLEADNESR